MTTDITGGGGDLPALHDLHDGVLAQADVARDQAIGLAVLRCLQSGFWVGESYTTAPWRVP